MASAPQSVDDITSQALNFGYDADRAPLQGWLRTAAAMQKQANVYEREGDDTQTYILLFRHAVLVLDKLPKHPGVKTATKRVRDELAIAQKNVQSDLAKLEELKPRLAKRHKDYLERRRKQQEALRALEGRGEKLQAFENELDALSLSRNGSQRSRGSRTALDARENQGLAAKLAQREIRRRDAARRSVRQAGVSEEEEQERRAGGDWGNWEKQLRRESDEMDDDLSRDIQAVGRQQDALRNGSHTTVNFSRPTSVQLPSSYKYPSVPAQHAAPDYPGAQVPDPYTSPPPLPPPPPSRPPKELLDHDISTPRPPAIPPKRPPRPSSPSQLPPPIPGKYPEPLPSAPPVPGKYLDSSTPTPRPSSPFGAPDVGDDNSYVFKPSAYLENGDPLRTVFLPTSLRTKFLACALANTKRNLETCGILCGILKSNAFFVSRLIIPDQKSTSDTCETLNEEAIFEYVDKEDLIMMGWIHTHPTQTCFMSSRDLHTHSGYQVMLPESIAVVCAPSKDPSWGVFRLTNPPGLPTVLKCNKPGLFHPHDVDNIYTDAMKPGHVCELAQMPMEVVDLRS